MDSTLHPAGQAALHTLAQRLLASPNPQQQRFGNDLTRLIRLTSEGGLWFGRCRLLSLQGMADGGLAILAYVGAFGLVWDGQQPRPHEGGFTLALIVPSQYPHAKPDVRFLDPVAFTPHVLHPSCPIQETDLPRELLEYVERVRRQEAGWCCYIRSDAWLPTVDYDLALCLYLVSGVVTGARRWGERGTLNPLAREWFERETERLPLGDPLPFPHSEFREVDDMPSIDGPEEEEDPMAWDDPETEKPA